MRKLSIMAGPFGSSNTAQGQQAHCVLANMGTFIESSLLEN